MLTGTGKNTFQRIVKAYVGWLSKDSDLINKLKEAQSQFEEKHVRYKVAQSPVVGYILEGQSWSDIVGKMSEWC